MTRRRCARGVTLVEVIVAVLAVVLLAAILLPTLGGTHCGGRQMKDATQVRGIEQAMVIWANQEQGNFPLASRIDLRDATVPEKGGAKDTTANLFSMLIWNGNVSTELMISPAEANTAAIVQDDDYTLEAPKAAVDPANALWDPGFSADFTGGHIANSSYGHLLPAGPRRAFWRDDFKTLMPIVSNRGPEIRSCEVLPSGRLKPAYAIPESLTFLIHGSPHSWEGNVAYNDGRVSFETKMNPDGMRYRSPAGKVTDCLFFDEPDDAAGTNAFLGIFIRAGDMPKDFASIWD